MKITFQFVLTLFLALTVSTLHAEEVEYDLTIAETTISPAGKRVQALTVNGGIPAPVLRFREGDVAVLRVHNALKRETTSIHWHGLLVPNAEDGVPYLTTPPIKPGTTHTFRFPLIHAGTYWYHSHTGLQEQRGVYGSIVITPKGGETIRADHDVVLQLSDWTNENPKEVMRTLMRGSEWYAFKKGNLQSISGAIKAGALGEYIERERGKMPPMDISDVAYDAFWINGETESSLKAQPGERVRFRVINSGASSYFYLHAASGPLTVVAADGPEVEPIEVERLFIGMAETYDVIFTVPAEGAWEVRATAQDGSGHASIFVGEGEKQHAEDIPKPNPYSMDEMMEVALNDPLTTMHSAEELADFEPGPRPLSPYHRLRAASPTEISPEHPRRKIELRLTGDMQRYIWSFNGKTLAEESKIPVTKGEVLQIEMINDTMMHHPIHLHGHFFRLLNGQGPRAPLKHTVDVPPMTRRSIEFYANEEKDWFFHCHLLYHMDAGMARVVSYTEQGEDHEPALDPKLMNPTFFFAEGSVQNHMTMGMATFMSGREDLMATWDIGFGDHDEYEIDATWNHYFNPDWTSFLGYRFTNDPDAENRVIGGVAHRLPFLVTSFAQVDSEGDFRFGLGKDIPLTDRITIFGDVEFDTNTEWEWSVGAAYLISKRVSLITQFHSEHGFGGGIHFRF
ncbi:MAG: FtsP/CotA-like multicopper oxidase with cupredoxin domain [Verrucomicrobiales bacterium]|jgi:FtsP/CotA-like multicopper oxidase with cupredoxin domain